LTGGSPKDWTHKTKYYKTQRLDYVLVGLLKCCPRAQKTTHQPEAGQGKRPTRGHVASNGKLAGKKLNLFVESAAQARNKTGELEIDDETLKDYGEPRSSSASMTPEALFTAFPTCDTQPRQETGYVLAAVEGYDRGPRKGFQRGAWAGAQPDSDGGRVRMTTTTWRTTDEPEKIGNESRA